MLTYGAGMALVLTALTVTLALARGGLLAGLRRALPYVDRVAGVFLVLAGLYLVYYWIFNLRFDATGSTTGGGLAIDRRGMVVRHPGLAPGPRRLGARHAAGRRPRRHRRRVAGPPPAGHGARRGERRGSPSSWPRPAWRR